MSILRRLSCAFKAFGRAYAGARLTPSQANYWNGGGSPNSEIRASRDRTAARIRQLVRDMPWLDQSFDASVAYKVGEGFNFKPAVTDGSGKMLGAENRRIKDAFLWWCEHAEANRRDHFGDVQRLVVRQMLECGEAFVVHRYIDGQYRLQVYEPECIDSSVSAEDIDQGIRFDRDTNAFKGYFFRSLESSPQAAVAEAREIPAEIVIHLYRALRPWQRRGISPLVQVSLLAADLDQYLSNEISAQQMASRYLAFVTRQDGDVGGDEQGEEYLDNLTIRYLGNGESIQFAPGATRPVAGLESFQDTFLRILSTILKVPFHVITGKYTALNYNTLREIRNNGVHILKPEWTYLTRHFLQPVYDRWLDFAVASGELSLKGYWSPGGKMHWRKCFFMPPGIESVDVLRDIKGILAGRDAGIIDPQDWIMGQGEDPDEVISGLSEFFAKLKAAGLDRQTGLVPESDTKLGQAPSEL